MVLENVNDGNWNVVEVPLNFRATKEWQPCL